MPKPGEFVKVNGKWVKYENTNAYKRNEQAAFNMMQANKLASLTPLAKGMGARIASANNLEKAAANAAAAYEAGVAVKYRKSRKANRKNRKSRKANRKNRKNTRRANRK